MKKPILVVIDIQKEYNTPGRPFFLKGIAPSLEKAGRLLTHAREHQWKIIHVQHLQEGSIFNDPDGYGDFIDGFHPLPGEEHVIKNNFSSYSSEKFIQLTHDISDQRLIVIGYGSTMCCLSTIIDGYHRGHKYVFVHDASWSKSGGELTEESRHLHATETLRTFSDVQTTDQIVQ